MSVKKAAQGLIQKGKVSEGLLNIGHGEAEIDSEENPSDIPGGGV